MTKARNDMIEIADSDSISLAPLVGPDMYAAWISMLKALAPVDRGNRMKSVVAAMLQYAYLRRKLAPTDEAGRLLQRARELGPGDPLELLFPILKTLFRDAGFAVPRAEHPNRTGGPVYDAIREFVIWENRPWE
jgi:hypothetical protein